MKHPIRSDDDIEQLQFNDQGLIPVIAQDEATGTVLMMAWANKAALRISLETGRMTYFSRSRNDIWEKGATSGNTQRVIALAADCDKDAVLAVVDQTGPACHEDTGTCWTHRRDGPVATMLGVLDRIAEHRLHEPQGRYTDDLLKDPELAASKIVEEAKEVAAVLRGLDNEDTLEHEAADLLYHLVVALRGQGTSLTAALQELRKRH